MADDDGRTTPPADDENKIPRSRLNAEIQKRKDLEQRLADIEAQHAELQDRDKPEIERLSRDLERAQKKAEEADAKAERLERESQLAVKRSLVTEAAARLKFRDPADAARYIDDLDQIDDGKTAEAALKGIVKDRAYLVADESPKPKGLERVLAAGERTGQRQDGRQLSEQEFTTAKSAEAVSSALERIGIKLSPQGDE